MSCKSVLQCPSRLGDARNAYRQIGDGAGLAIQEGAFGSALIEFVYVVQA